MSERYHLPSTSIQFHLPRSVAESPELVARHIPYITAVDREHRGQVRVTTLATATELLELVRARGDATESADLLLACAAAFRTLDAAIQEGLQFWRSAPGRSHERN